MAILKRIHRLAVGTTAVGLALCAGTTAGAFDALDGRLQLHSFYETQLRALSADFAEDMDVVQWYHIFNVELEFDLMQRPLGPVDRISSFLRAEVRYDCVYSRACGLAHSVNTYGDRARRLPPRLQNGVDVEGAGAIAMPERDTNDLSRRKPREPLPVEDLPFFDTLFEQSIGPDDFIGNPRQSRDCVDLYGAVACANLAGGPLSLVGSPDDPLPAVFDRFDSFRFTALKQRGGSNYGFALLPMGPWLPKNDVAPIASMADVVNPLDNKNSDDVIRAAFLNGELINNLYNRRVKDGTPINQSAIDDFINVRGVESLLDTISYRGSLPFRPIPVTAEGGRNVEASTPRGIFLPSKPVRELIESGDLGDFPFNYGEDSRAFNHGQSQRQTRELKEAYLDIEMLDARIWLRLGKQTIVWGKTELFSPTDQFNPQDFALASLPSLEESRIGLWSLRGVYSFWNVGPFQDVRLEAGLIFDEFQPADLGACGEAYTANPVCALTFGAWSHGFTGIGVAGIEEPPDPWEDLKGLQFGARLEWRWDRLSFAVSDFYGYSDFPHPERVVTYERNVDPETGMPRQIGVRGPCGLSRSEANCLFPGPQVRVSKSDLDQAKADLEDALVSGTPEEIDRAQRNLAFLREQRRLGRQDNTALLLHPANQQLFAFVCSATVGIAGNTNPSGCGSSAFNGQSPPRANLTFTTAQVTSATLAGSTAAEALGVFAVASDTRISGLAEITAFAIVPVVTLDPNTGNPSAPTLRGQLGDLYNLQDRASSPCSDPIWFDNPNNQFAGKQIADCGGIGWTTFDLQASDPLSRDALGLAEVLSPEQEALLGCGPFYDINCDISGIDWLNAEGSVLVQSFPGFEGTVNGWRTDGLMPRTGRFKDLRRDRGQFNALGTPRVWQPGTRGFQGGPVCTTAHIGGPVDPDYRLPGCRGPYDKLARLYDPDVDGDPRKVATLLDANDPRIQIAISNGYVPANLGDILVPQNTAGHPFTGQPFKSEMAALSWNLLVVAVLGSDNFNALKAYQAGRCSFITPQHCDAVQGILELVATRRNVVRAGGNGTYGRRDFSWHGGGVVTLAYDKRNVLGFAMDFSEDRTKSNWSLELTWLHNVPVIDNDKDDGLTRAEELNLVVSVDRPTFINFLNDGRTFFFNSQWFFQYRTNYSDSWVNNGPFNALATFTAFTGYYQDRLLPQLTFVYDFQSVSGAALPQVTYRVNANLSMTLGVSMFFGRQELVDMPVNPIAPGDNRAGPNAYKDSWENGLSVIRDRDEVFFKLRYSF